MHSSWWLYLQSWSWIMQSELVIVRWNRRNMCKYWLLLKVSVCNNWCGKKTIWFLCNGRMWWNAITSTTIKSLKLSNTTTTSIKKPNATITTTNNSRAIVTKSSSRRILSRFTNGFEISRKPPQFTNSFSLQRRLPHVLRPIHFREHPVQNFWTISTKWNCPFPCRECYRWGKRKDFLSIKLWFGF